VQTVTIKAAKLRCMGNVGGTTAKLLKNEGCKTIAVSDVSGGVYCKSGLDIEAIFKFIEGNNGKMLKDYIVDGVKHITNGVMSIVVCGFLMVYI
jgi:glutamate dehydrogenase (NAD(P)+)